MGELYVRERLAQYPTTFSLHPFSLCYPISQSQVYYECFGMGDPLALKSARAQRLYAHLRHPVCLELGVVLWLLPTFPLDRFLLAGYLTVYLALAHSLDTQDCAYLSVQLRSKMKLFSVPPDGSVQASATTANNNNNNNHKHDD